MFTHYKDSEEMQNTKKKETVMKASEFKAKRQELKMTQVQFAKMLGITARQVINIEKGVNKVTDTIKKLIENKSMMTIQVNKKRVEIAKFNFFWF